MNGQSFLIVTDLKFLSPGDLNNQCVGFLMHSFIVFQIMSLLTLLYKYGCHITHSNQTAITLNGHIDPTYLSISTKIQPTATAT